MANQTLGKQQTSLVNAGRSRVSNASQGDLWAALNGNVTNAEYNSIATGFNTLKTLIHTTITGGFTVTGTKENGDPQAIGDDADGPIILTLPSS